MEQKYSDTLISSRKDGKLAYTKHLFDVPENLSQEVINTKFKSAITKIAELESTLVDQVREYWEKHQTDVDTLKNYTDSKTKSISRDYIINSAKLYLD